MEIIKKEEIKIKLTLDEALRMLNEFDKVSGITDDMVIMEFIEHLQNVT